MSVKLNGVDVSTIKINGDNAIVKVNGNLVFPVTVEPKEKVWMFLYDTSSQENADVYISKGGEDYYNEQDAFEALEGAYPASSMAVGSLAAAGWHTYYMFEVQLV